MYLKKYQKEKVDYKEGGKIYHCPYTVADFESLADICE